MPGQVKRTGQFGDIYLVKDIPATMTAEACAEVTALPGDSTLYPAKTFYQITAANKRIIDMDAPITVKDGAVTLSPTLYTVHYGAGIIEFYAARTGTPAITVDGSFIDPTGALVKAGSVKDWSFTLTSADVDASEYGTGFGSRLAGLTEGTFDFEKFQTDLAMYQRVRNGKRFILAFYENLSAPAYWIAFGRVLSFPVAAPIGGMVGGKVSGRLLQWPDFRTDSIG